MMTGTPSEESRLVAKRDSRNGRDSVQNTRNRLPACHAVSKSVAFSEKQRFDESLSSYL